MTAPSSPPNAQPSPPPNDAEAPVFDLRERLVGKSAPAMIARDEEHFARIAVCLDRQVAELEDRLDRERRAPGGHGTGALERDQEIHRLTGRLRLLRRFGVDLCLGRMVPADGGEPVYVGRAGLTDGDGTRLLVDWRSGVAEPFFGATHADSMGLTSRRRYRWTAGRITDYWDEVFAPDGREGHAALDDQSAFIASLGASRTGRMRDVLGTIQADQDAIVRAGSQGVLVVDGGPGTGKTVVALHRTAYLLYSDPRLGHRRGGVLFVGPHRPYLAYVGDVLPSLGEEGVRTCTLRDLVPEGATAAVETDPEVARLKSTADMVRAIEPAVAFYENPPQEAVTVETPWADLLLRSEDWAEAFAAPDPDTPHNEARDQIWEALLDILLDQHGDEQVPPEQLRRSLSGSSALRRAVNRAWPVLEPTDLVGDLWSVPAYLRRCAPWLTVEEVRRLQRDRPDAWTESDLPLLDAAYRRLGDPQVSERRRRRAAEVASERAQMDDVVSDLVATDDSELRVMSMLRGQDLRDALVDPSGEMGSEPDELAGPFAHVVVDEAQELTDAQWQMLLDRCPSRSLTVVGDRAQARQGFTESWPERLERVGLGGADVASLTINYRTPQEVMAAAEPVIRAAVPDANVPTSVRAGGVPVQHGVPEELDSILEEWLREHPDGTACVVGGAVQPSTERVSHLSPEEVKGLEFDLVVLVDPASFGGGVQGAVDRYVAMTRATGRLVVLEPRGEPGGN